MAVERVSLACGVLAKISDRILNEVRGIHRVVLDISSKPQATIEWESGVVLGMDPRASCEGWRREGPWIASGGRGSRAARLPSRGRGGAGGPGRGAVEGG